MKFSLLFIIILSSKAEDLKECEQSQLKDIERGTHLGNGVQGIVYRIPGSVQVVKAVTKPEQIKATLNEIEVLKKANASKYVSTFYDSCFITSSIGSMSIFIFMEMCEMDLETAIKNTPKSSRYFWDMIDQIIKMLIELNSHGVYHLDNQIGNFMICGGKLKMIDFGSSKIASNKLPNLPILELKSLLQLINTIKNEFQIRCEKLTELEVMIARIPPKSTQPPFTLEMFRIELKKIRNDCYNIPIQTDVFGSLDYLKSSTFI